MGATIIDGILQAGINYKNTVEPRVNDYLEKYSGIKTTKQFKELLDEISVSKLINWKESAKTERIQKLTEFLLEEGINTEEEFGKWLNLQENIYKLTQISGIKSKTADYFKILTGHNTSAIDRHLIGFLENAGIHVIEYEKAQQIISQTAKLLNVKESHFDHSIWKYMSESKG
ncbi:MAG: hypothetical protein ACI86H_001011 [bacterium]